MIQKQSTTNSKAEKRTKAPKGKVENATAKSKELASPKRIFGQLIAWADVWEHAFDEDLKA